MLIGFIGDVHGRVYHALAAVVTWQRRQRRRFDYLVQVGDLGVFPDPARMDAATQRYLAVDPAEADFSRLLQATGPRADLVRRLRNELTSPIHCLRGNHEDQAWLWERPIEPLTSTAPLDPFDCFRFVPDGTVLTWAGRPIAFLGGIESDQSETAINREAYQRLSARPPGLIEVLVTHDAPYGVSTGYHGQVQGSSLITRLVETLQPRYHVAGHLTLIGPRPHGRTTFLCLDGLVASPRWQPDARGLAPGCLAVLDTERPSLAPVTDGWLTDFPTPFDLDGWAETVFSETAPC